METWSFIVGIASLIVGIISIILAIVAMNASKKESDRSAENYIKTKELLDKIEHKSDIIDRAIQIQQAQLVQIINKALDKIGQTPIDFQPITEEEINALFEKNQKQLCEKIDSIEREMENKISVDEELILNCGDSNV